MLCDANVLNHGTRERVRQISNIVCTGDDIIFDALRYPRVTLFVGDSINLNVLDHGLRYSRQQSALLLPL